MYCADNEAPSQTYLTRPQVLMPTIAQAGVLKEPHLLDIVQTYLQRPALPIGDVSLQAPPRWSVHDEGVGAVQPMRATSQTHQYGDILLLMVNRVHKVLEEVDRPRCKTAPSPC